MLKRIVSLSPNISWELASARLQVHKTVNERTLGASSNALKRAKEEELVTECAGCHDETNALLSDAVAMKDRFRAPRDGDVGTRFREADTAVPAPPAPSHVKFAASCLAQLKRTVGESGMKFQPSAGHAYCFTHSTAAECWVVAYSFRAYPWAVQVERRTLDDGALGVAICIPVVVRPLVGVFADIACLTPDLSSVCIDISILTLVWDQDSTNEASVTCKHDLVTLGPHGAGFPAAPTRRGQRGKGPSPGFDTEAANILQAHGQQGDCDGDGDAHSDNDLQLPDDEGSVPDELHPDELADSEDLAAPAADASVTTVSTSVGPSSDSGHLRTWGAELALLAQACSVAVSKAPADKTLSFVARTVALEGASSNAELTDRFQWVFSLSYVGSKNVNQTLRAVSCLCALPPPGPPPLIRRLPPPSGTAQLAPPADHRPANSAPKGMITSGAEFAGGASQTRDKRVNLS